MIGKPGKIVIAEIEVENGTHYPWKEGASLQSDFSNLTADVLDEVALPIDWNVAENSKFKICIPLKIKDLAKAGEQIYEANLMFHGR